MLPYVSLELIKGRVSPTGCLGEIWTTLAENQKINSRYTIYDAQNPVDIVLQGATGRNPRAIQLAFVSSWYDKIIIPYKQTYKFIGMTFIWNNPKLL